MSAIGIPSTTRQPTLVDVVELACLAPSVHNTQPWTWRISGSTLELYADPRRLLPATDPQGDQLVVSCGAALHHAQIAARGLGWEPQVTRLPGGPDMDLLARIDLTPAPRTPSGLAALELLRERRTDRRHCTSWPVPDARLAQLADTAGRWGVIATPVTDSPQRWRVEDLIAEASKIQSNDPRTAREQAAWVDRGPEDGIPSDVVPDETQHDPSHMSRFGPGTLKDSDREFDRTDALIVLGSVTDDRAAWLRAGEALSALWLDATLAGLTVVPLSQPIEVPQTRRVLQHDVLVSLVKPHVLVRVGWPAMSRTTLPAVPHRPLDEVLRS